MLDKDTLNRIRLTRRAAESLSNARTKLGPAFGRQLARLESSIRAAMTLAAAQGFPLLPQCPRNLRLSAPECRRGWGRARCRAFESGVNNRGAPNHRLCPNR
jgi:hypothetical protein